MTFKEIYLEELLNAVTDYPNVYTFPKEDVPKVADKMIAALSKGHAHIDGIALRRTCRRSGISMSRAAIMSRLEEDMEKSTAEENL